MPARLSLCLIAKNEEANLPACLQSAADLVDEIIVVDTGSTDRTKEVAAGLGARVFDFTWCDSFSAARNESLRHATSDWILWLDGDEALDDANRRRFRALRESLNGPAAYVLVQRSTAEAAGAAPTEVHQVRLFRNHPDIRWSYRVHEQILPGVRRAGHEVRFTDIAIRHGGYTDPALRRRKTERNLRLLLLEYQEQPDDPFTLFNLGWAYQDLGRIEEALPLLRRSLERSQPGDSIVRKLYVLIAHAHRRLGQVGEALAVCAAGRARCPDDPELLNLEGALREELGDLDGAAACWRQLVHLRPGIHFASREASLGERTARHRLAVVLGKRGRPNEAEAEWRAVLAEEPSCPSAWLELGRLYLAQGRWDDLDAALGNVPAGLPWVVEATVLRARGCLARRELAAARRLLEEAAAQDPQAVSPRVFLTHALLQEGLDAAAAERVLREVLTLDPRQGEAWRNLAVLLHQQGRRTDAAEACRGGLEHCPGDRRLLRQAGLFLAEAGDARGAETCLVRFLEMPAAADDSRARAEQADARHRLALLLYRQGRAGEAEAQWRAILADQPAYLAALLGLAEVCLDQRRDGELEELIGRLDACPDGALEAAVLRARRLQAMKAFATARQLLEETIARWPQVVWPRLTLSHVLFEEGQDPAATERVLREVLALEPGHPQARRNLQVLLRRQGMATEGAAVELRNGEGDEPAALVPPHPQPLAPEGRGEQLAPLAPRGRGAGSEGATLRLAFVCFNPLPLHLDTPYQRPLGGSESSLCYLAEALAGRGHQVAVLHPGPGLAVSRGVCCLPLHDRSVRQLGPLDALVLLNLAGRARDFRPLLDRQTLLILWSQHHLDQPAVQPLRDPAERGLYDGFALVSEWQRQEYLRHFGLDPQRTGVLRNGIAPAFENLFPAGTSIAERKTRPPVLVYTSTPYRGLDLLLEAFPRIREAVPEATLKVFSGMSVYQVPAAEDQARFGALYQRCHDTEGVEYVGSLPQPQLAAELGKAAVLAYPNTYPETSCIAVLEALAAGCTVVTIARGALPETSAGFARLVPVDADRETYRDRFVEATVQALASWPGAEATAEDQLWRQVAHVHQQHAWSALAETWSGWLRQLRARVAP